MSLSSEKREIERLERKLADPDVQRLMAIRCEAQGHQWENCMSMYLQVYQGCGWCGARR
jgi:hypothetical protein